MRKVLLNQIVTPADAAFYINRSANGEFNNIRSINQTRVKFYADMMKNGEWKDSHQGIAFNSSGGIADGWHRLTACIQAKIPFRTDITTGLSKDSIAIIDSGFPRTVNCRLNIAIGANTPNSHIEVYKILNMVYQDKFLTTASISELTRIIAKTEAVVTDFHNFRVRQHVRAKRSVTISRSDTAGMRAAACLLILDDPGYRIKNYIYKQHIELLKGESDSLSKFVKSCAVDHHSQCLPPVYGGSNMFNSVAFGMIMLDPKHQDNSFSKKDMSNTALGGMRDKAHEIMVSIMGKEHI